MSSTLLALACFTLATGGAWLGFWLRTVAPEHHISEGTKDVVRQCAGLAGTLTGLLLSMMIASGKAQFDRIDGELRGAATNFLLLDQTLQAFGDEALPVRRDLRAVLAEVDRLGVASLAVTNGILAPWQSAAPLFHRLGGSIASLPEATVVERVRKSEALSQASELRRTRWQLQQDAAPAISVPFYGMILVWLGMIFGSFALFAPRNIVSYIVLGLGAGLVSSALFLIHELDSPFTGFIRVPDGHIQEAADFLGKV